MDERTKHALQISEAKAALKTAGPIHRRDLMHQIRRMEKELRIYDRFMRRAGRGETSSVTS